MSRSKKIHDLITNKESHEAARRDTGGEPEEDVGEIREKEMEMVLEEDEEADVHASASWNSPAVRRRSSWRPSSATVSSLTSRRPPPRRYAARAERTSFSAAATAAYTVSKHFAMADGRIRQ